jgi:hypothetical protein
VLLQMGLVEKSAVRDNRPSNGDENAAAYVSYKFDDPRDLIARLFRKSCAIGWSLTPPTP